MFERYTERARRVLFLAHAEASKAGSHEINTEHLLLAIFREAPDLMKQFVPDATLEKVRRRVRRKMAQEQPVLTGVDIPFGRSAMTVVRYAAEEAGPLGQEHIGCEHLLLAIARVKGSLAAQILGEHGLDIVKARAEMGRTVREQPTVKAWGRLTSSVEAATWAVSFQWRERRFEPHDALRNIADHRLALYHGEPFDPAKFVLVKGGWVHFRCTLCSESLYDAEDPTENLGYTNGQEYLCPFCYERFTAPESEDESQEDEG